MNAEQILKALQVIASLIETTQHEMEMTSPRLDVTGPLDEALVTIKNVQNRIRNSGVYE
jgi:hypothetical protein